MLKTLKKAFLIILSLAFIFLIACDTPDQGGDQGGGDNNPPPPANTDWVDVGANVTNYDFSFMVIGDTQIVTSEHPDKLKNIYDYVLDNVTSKKVNISTACINRWEKNLRVPNIDSIIILCQFFGCSSDYLIGLEN